MPRKCMCRRICMCRHEPPLCDAYECALECGKYRRSGAPAPTGCAGGKIKPLSTHLCSLTAKHSQ
eukprot:7359484-Prymnesium_polylepis.1